jgi:hypothetical protein
VARSSGTTDTHGTFHGFLYSNGTYTTLDDPSTGHASAGGVFPHSSRFGATTMFSWVTPVTLPPGRLRLATRPSQTGSLPISKTIGMVAVSRSPSYFHPDALSS